MRLCHRGGIERSWKDLIEAAVAHSRKGQVPCECLMLQQLGKEYWLLNKSVTVHESLSFIKWLSRLVFYFRLFTNISVKTSLKYCHSFFKCVFGSVCLPEMKISMTAPVLVRLIAGQGPACKSNFTMSFFDAPKVPNPPAPTDKTVFFSTLPKQKVYVR